MSQEDRPIRLVRRKIIDRVDIFIRLSHLRDPFKTAGQTKAEIEKMRQNKPISKWTVLRRLKMYRLRARPPVSLRKRHPNSPSMASLLTWVESQRAFLGLARLLC